MESHNFESNLPTGLERKFNTCMMHETMIHGGFKKYISSSRDIHCSSHKSKIVHPLGPPETSIIRCRSTKVVYIPTSTIAKDQNTPTWHFTTQLPPAKMIPSHITEDSLEYTQAFDEAHKYADYEPFDKCVKLQGSSNYIVWRRKLETCAMMGGHRRHLSKEWLGPRKPNGDMSDVPPEEWNRYMLRRAFFMGLNDVMLSCIKLTLAPHMEDAIEGCELVKDAMEKLDEACPPATMDTYLACYRRFYDYSFDYSRNSYDEFFHGFSERFFALQNLKGAQNLTESEKCSRFLDALGPRFLRWAEQKRLHHSEGRDLNFCRLQYEAQLKWQSMSKAPEEVWYLSMSPEMNIRQNRKRMASHSGIDDEWDMWKAYGRNPRFEIPRSRRRLRSLGIEKERRYEERMKRTRS